jgi:hypothetical protein
MMMVLVVLVVAFGGIAALVAAVVVVAVPTELRLELRRQVHRLQGGNTLLPATGISQGCHAHPVIHRVRQLHFPPMHRVRVRTPSSKHESSARRRWHKPTN